MKKSISLLLSCFCAALLHAQPNLHIQRLTTADGLSDDRVTDILQSRDGFIWIATQNGLNRYDGVRLEVFLPEPFNQFSISGNLVFRLFEDSRGWIWILLVNGIDVLDPKSGHFFHLKWQSKAIPSLCEGFAETADGAIWFAEPSRILKYNIQKDLLKKAHQQDQSEINPIRQEFDVPFSDEWGALEANCLFFTKRQKLLIGTTHGLFTLDRNSGRFDLIGMATEDIRWISQNPTGHLWILTSMGRTTVWDENAGMQQRRTIQEPITSVIHDSAGFCWIIQDSGLNKFQLQRLLNNETYDIHWTNDRFFPKNEHTGVKSGLLDRSGMLWLSSYGAHGVIKLNPNIPVFKSNLLNTAQFDAAGNYWNNNSLVPYRRDAKTGDVQEIPSWNDQFGLCFDAKGWRFSLNREGLLVLNPKTTESRSFALKPSVMHLKDFSYASQYLWKASDGAIWIFGIKGLVKAIPDNEAYKFKYFAYDPKDRSSLSSNLVNCVVDDPIEPDRYLWIGTEGGGLNCLDKQSGKFKHYTKEQGLPSNTIVGVLAENKKPYIWLSTDKGLCCFDVRAEAATNFTVADGLPDNRFNHGNYLKTRDGAMVFGSINGLTAFYPDSLRFNTTAPQTRIVGLRVNNQTFDFAGKSSITLSRDENLLAFDFAALEFTNPAQNQYRYQLIGVDKDWVSLGTKNSIQFAGLSPGTYTFKVMGSNNHGVWSEQPAVLRFTIRPPWWASWWAYLLYLGLIAGGIWQYYQYLLRQRFSEQEKLRLKELDDFKSRFFTNITHEFRTPLTVMLGMSEQLVKDEKDAPKRNQLHLIKRNGENLLRLINQILDLSKLESNTLKMNYIQGDILTFVKYIAESLHSLANAHNLILRVESDQAKIIMDYDPERFLQIIHNLLSNAIKFTPSGGKVVLNVAADLAGFGNLPSLNIRVTDTGPGIPPEELPHLFERFFQAKNQEHAKAGGAGIGLSLTRELVKAMGGEISVESPAPGGSVGTTFLVKLPIANKGAFVSDGATRSHPVTAQAGPLSVGVTSSHPDTKPTLLLIEDNPDVVEYLTSCLKGQYNLDFAYNGQAGIEKALETVPDLIISDVMMPFKDGFEVLDTLKSDEHTSHIPIVLLTAKADIQSRLVGLRRGADAYLSKPFHQEELLVTVENLLELRRKLQVKYQQNILAPIVALPAPAEVPADMEDAFLQNIRAVIEANYADDAFGLPQLCQKIGMSRSQLFRKMKALVDIAPSDLIRSHRLNKAKALLESGTANVAEAAWQTGFKDASYFSKLYQEEFGVAPSGVGP